MVGLWIFLIYLLIIIIIIIIIVVQLQTMQLSINPISILCNDVVCNITRDVTCNIVTQDTISNKPLHSLPPYDVVKLKATTTSFGVVRYMVTYVNCHTFSYANRLEEMV